MKSFLIKVLKKIGNLTYMKHNKVSEWIWNTCFDLYLKLKVA